MSAVSAWRRIGRGGLTARVIMKEAGRRFTQKDDCSERAVGRNRAFVLRGGNSYESVASNPGGRKAEAAGDFLGAGLAFDLHPHNDAVDTIAAVLSVQAFSRRSNVARRGFPLENS